MRRFYFVLLALVLSCAAFADTKYFITNPVFHVDNPTTGEPLSGGLIYFYEPGTTTPKDTWSDASGDSEYVNTNPVVLNSYGNATIYGATSYKVIIKTSAGTTLATMDNVQFSQTITTFANEILAADDAAAVRTALGLGTASLVDSGTGANNALVLDSTGALPAIDGSKLTGFTDDQIRVLPQGYLSGFTMSNYVSGDVNVDIQIATGACRDSGDTEDIILSSVMIKKCTGTFTEGSGENGCFPGEDTGENTWHVFTIKDVSDDVVDVMFCTSASPSTLPSGFSKYRRIGAVLADATSYVVGFHQFGDTFLLKTPVLDNDGSSNTVGSTPENITLTVPEGIEVFARINAALDHISTEYDSVYLYYPGLNDVTPGHSYNLVAPLATLGRINSTANFFAAVQGNIEILTNTSAQIRAVNVTHLTGVATNGTVESKLYIATLGWLDRRGRD